MQSTVYDHDARSGTGRVLLDDGSVLAYDAKAFAAGGARLLRVGQRVALRFAEGHLVCVALPPFI